MQFIAAATDSRPAAILVAIFIYGWTARSIFTGHMLVRGYRGRGVYRSERPLTFWYCVTLYLTFATLFLVTMCVSRDSASSGGLLRYWPLNFLALSLPLWIVVRKVEK